VRKFIKVEWNNREDHDNFIGNYRRGFRRNDANAMNRNSIRLLLLSSLLWHGVGTREAYGRDPQVTVEQLLQTTQAWNGTEYTHHLTGQPQITILRISIPPNSALDWHEHPMISAGYVLSGQITLEMKRTGKRKTFHAGEALAETVNAVHRGYTTQQPVELVVFYAGSVGLPLSIKAK
jgi:quercetin dioxygenase-like cupin family protein